MSFKPVKLLIIIDFYIPDNNHPHYKRALLSDAILLATFQSANRTLSEWENLINRTNLKITNIFPAMKI